MPPAVASATALADIVLVAGRFAVRKLASLSGSRRIEVGVSDFVVEATLACLWRMLEALGILGALAEADLACLCFIYSSVVTLVIIMRLHERDGRTGFLYLK